MFQAPCEMENGHNVVNMSTSNTLQMIPFDDNDPEVIARRIKNRERQRRYRARKRLEADMKRAGMISQPIQLQVDETQVNDTPETQVNDTPVEIVTRVHSQRNWKKDARRAHVLKQEEENSISSPSASFDQRFSGNQPNITVETREHSSTPSGRNWKAEARNKRN